MNRTVQDIRTINNDYKQQVEAWQGTYTGTSFVFNDRDHTEKDYARTQLILIADNPGIEELHQRRYLVSEPQGPSKNTAGRIAWDFFPEYLGFTRADTIIANKCAIHSPKTTDLKLLRKTHPDLLATTQKRAAQLVADLHQALATTNPQVLVWVCGLAGCWDSKTRSWRKPGIRGNYPATAILPEFYAELADRYRQFPAALRNQLVITKHFSRGQFFHDLEGIQTHSLNGLRKAGLTPEEVLSQVRGLDYSSKLLNPDQ